MKKIFFILCLSFFSLYAAQIEITSKKFEADQKKLFSKFIGNVIFKKGSDIIKADEVFIYFNKAKKPQKIDAKGHVTFVLHDQQGKKYKGKAKEVIYYPSKKEYYLRGSVEIVQFPQKKRIYAQNIYLNLQQSKISVKGTQDTPVKMIFTIEEK
ncbi:lipopolysaccharide transport periplasmic protein LptA [Nitratiruptor tergarcus]|uniref:Lipopolysaccharide export system protein LptA n=1 Tax=Nitratiruptor tergarcus DSM 16512 TaxID=1069081 RepID=A0A1W1WTJ5_9BACT|nr:lipopolysaccharide transport periplasmic protein LptA [Nitratiruptor tergarcus]SMC09556.1 lipopolysaccharide export system protein LptA [Nitratiruptor tergarcus DSM 16512]